MACFKAQHCVGGLQCLFENFKVCLYCMHYVKASTAGYEICKFSGNTSYLFCFMLTLLLITSKLTLECIRSATCNKWQIYSFFIKKWMSWTIQKDLHILHQICQIHYLLETQITIYKKKWFPIHGIQTIFALHAPSRSIQVFLKLSGASIVILSGVCHFHYMSILQTNLTEIPYLVSTVDLDNIMGCMAHNMLSLPCS